MSTNKNSNRIEVPEAKQALDQFKSPGSFQDGGC